MAVQGGIVPSCCGGRQERCGGRERRPEENLGEGKQSDQQGNRTKEVQLTLKTAGPFWRPTFRRKSEWSGFPFSPVTLSLFFY